MFGQAYFEPWHGPQYGKSKPRLLVIGESQYDEAFTDKQIIQERVNGQRHRTYTNFVQAAIGTRHWEQGYDEQTGEVGSPTEYGRTHFSICSEPKIKCV
jgi:hypothetical protein